VLASRLIGYVTHTGELPVATGAAGVVLITTVVVDTGDTHVPMVAVTEYVPAISNVAPAIEGFCAEELKEFGPVQL